MRNNTKPIVASVIVVIAALTGIFAFCSFKGKYGFKSEPKLQKPEVSLEKRSLQSRDQLTTQLCRDNLGSDTQKNAYDEILKHAENADNERFHLNGATKNDLQIAINAVRADHPEVFWLDNESCYRYYEYEDGITAELNYSMTGDELEEAQSDLNSVVNQIIAQAPDNATDYDVELFINEYMIEACHYEPQCDQKHSAYGALVLGQAVCDGYSHAFQLLCRCLGIECTVIEGTSDFNENADDGHMWNCILLGDEWYHVDVTWNDVSNAACEAERYFYLNLDDSQILQDHIISGGFEQRMDNKGNYFNIFVPKCSSDLLCYMKMNFVTIADPEFDDQIIASLIDASRRRSTCCAYLINETRSFKELSGQIADKYAAEWVKAANHFTDRNPEIAENGRIITYENKRVLVIMLSYTE